MAMNWKGLLDSGALGDFGTGLLANSGYSTTPVTFGQALAGGMQNMNQRQKERMEMEFARNKLEQEQAKAKAMKEMSALMQPGQTPGPVSVPTPAPYTTPQGQAQMMGLLGQVAPEAVAQGLLAQQFQKTEAPRVSTDYNTFKELYPELQEGTPAFRDQFLTFTAESDPTGALMDQAQLALLTQELAAARESRAEKTETATQERSSTVRHVIQDVSKLKEMADLNSRLEGTALETGLPMPELRRAWAGGVQALQSLTGGDTSKAEALKADFDRFNKLSTDFVVGSLDRLAGTGAITDTKFQALMSSNASLGASPGANNLIIADNMEALLDAAEIEDIGIKDAANLRSLIGTLRGTRSTTPNAPASAILNPSGSSSEIDALNAEIQALEARLRGQ